MVDYIILALLILVFILLIILILKKSQTQDISSDISKLERTLREEGSLSRNEQSQAAKQSREELSHNLREMVNVQFSQLREVSKNNNETMDNLTKTIESRLNHMQQDNNAKLEQMRAVVDEKLHKTLETRLSESFKTVSERLEQVHKGLGEMQSLAQGVGDLKRVLSSPKTRGILGELQLGNLIEQVLSTAQYDTNVATIPSSSDFVEYAIKIPSSDDTITYLPVDAKFPVEDYTRLLDAYDTGDANLIANAKKVLENVIKKCAKDINKKYIYPPNTTDFAIMFLPVEGLYAEVARQPGLIEILQRDFKVIISGPTTFTALLTSLQLGFRTLAIQKRSTDVWKILSSVRTEFEKFENVLENAQKHIIQVGDDIEKLAGVRTKKIMKELNKADTFSSDVQLLPDDED